MGADGDLRMFIGRGTKVYVLPLLHRGQVSFDITALNPDSSWAPAVTKEDILATVEGFDQRIVTMAEALDMGTVNVRAVYDIDPVEVWHSDAVVLIGDAAHAMCHHQGQGANSAILDAGAIADALTAEPLRARGPRRLPGDPQARHRRAPAHLPQRLERRRARRSLPRSEAGPGRRDHPGLTSWHCIQRSRGSSAPSRRHRTGRSTRSRCGPTRSRTCRRSEERLPLHAVEDTTVPTAEGRCRSGSTPRPSRRRPGVVVYLHGGAFFLGSLDTHDHVARSLAKETGMNVVSVGYRRAPEAAFPAGLDDCYAVVRWAAGGAGPAAPRRRRRQLGRDVRRRA